MILQNLKKKTYLELRIQLETMTGKENYGGTKVSVAVVRAHRRVDGQVGFPVELS